MDQFYSKRNFFYCLLYELVSILCKLCEKITKNKCHRSRKYVCKLHSQRSVAYLSTDCPPRKQNLKKKAPVDRKMLRGHLDGFIKKKNR